MSYQSLFEFYAGKCHLRRNSYEWLWSFLFRLCMDPKACSIITFIGEGLKFRILDLETLALLYYFPNDTFIFTDQEIMNLFRSALARNQAICNCWATSKPQNREKMSSHSSDNDVYDFTELRENEMQIYSGMNMDQLLNYAFCVSPAVEEENFASGDDDGNSIAQSKCDLEYTETIFVVPAIKLLHRNR